MNLLTLQSAGEILDLPKKSTLKLLKELKVDLYYLGNGRGKGYRVEYGALMSALDTKKVSLDKPQKKAKRSNKFEGSMKDIMLSLTKSK